MTAPKPTACSPAPCADRGNSDPRFPMPSLLRQLPAFVLASLLTSWAAPATAGAGRANPFFAFDNGVGRGDGWSPEKQAVTLARLGYAGIGYTGLDDLATRQAERLQAQSKLTQQASLIAASDAQVASSQASLGPSTAQAAPTWNTTCQAIGLKYQTFSSG